MTEQIMTRDELAARMTAVVRRVTDKLTAERFMPHPTDSEYYSGCRVLVQLATATNTVLRDRELAEILERLEALEEEAKHARK